MSLFVMKFLLMVMTLFYTCYSFYEQTFYFVVNRDEVYGVEGLTVDTRAEDLRHVWIRQSLKMCINKTHGLEVCSWSETDEVRKSL